MWGRSMWGRAPRPSKPSAAWPLPREQQSPNIPESASNACATVEEPAFRPTLRTDAEGFSPRAFYPTSASSSRHSSADLSLRSPINTGARSFVPPSPLSCVHSANLISATNSGRTKCTFFNPPISP